MTRLLVRRHVIEALCAALVLLVVVVDVSRPDRAQAEATQAEDPAELAVPLTPVAGEVVSLSAEVVLPLPAASFAWGETKTRSQAFDLAAPARVYAARAGVVVSATGHQVTIRHSDGTLVRYGPMRFWVVPGDRVEAGSELGWADGPSFSLTFATAPDLFDPRLWLVPPDLVVGEELRGQLVSSETTPATTVTAPVETAVDALLSVLSDSEAELAQVLVQADSQREVAELLRADTETVEGHSPDPVAEPWPTPDVPAVGDNAEADNVTTGDHADAPAVQAPASRVNELVDGASPAVASELVRAVQVAADGLDATADTLVERARDGRRAVVEAIGRGAGLDQVELDTPHAQAAAVLQRYLDRLVGTGAPVLTRDQLLTGDLPDGVVLIGDDTGAGEAGVARWTSGSVALLPQETLSAVARAFALVGTTLEHADAWSCARLPGAAYPELSGLLPFEQAALTSAPARLRMGDLVFYGTARSGVDDVAVFVGQGLVIRTDATGTVVVAELDAARVWGAGRLLGEQRDVPAVRPGMVEWRCGEPRLTATPDRDASWGGHANGAVPAWQLCGVSFASGHRLRCDAAAALELLAERFEANFGYPMCMTDSYRPLAGQVRVRAAKPHLAAVPGTSIHGWGLAVDLCRRNVTSLGFGDAEYRWLWANAPKFGWVHPPWARVNGSKPEPWHWEFGLFGQSWSTAAGAPPAPVAARIVDEAGDDGPSEPEAASALELTDRLAR
jgi:cell wall-associated NlpC family hydrolase